VRREGFGGRLLVAAAGVAGAVALVVALWQLIAPRLAVGRIEQVDIGGVPATVYAPGGAPGPAVVIAHGFAGSQQIMEPFALTLARGGFTAITIDFPGHGRNPAPLRGALADGEGRYAQLSAALDLAVSYARRAGDGRVGLVGHSMGSEAVVRYAEAHPEIAATVGVSLVYDGATATAPRNLLVITGALEGNLSPIARSVADAAAGGAGELERTYGDVAAGTARRVVLAPTVEHVGVLFSPVSMAETLAWFRAAMPAAGVPGGADYIDARAPWLGLLYVGATLLFWPFSRLLQPVEAGAAMAGGGAEGQPAAANGGRRARWGWWAAALAPALLTPPLLRLLPGSELLPILVGGPLALMFAAYGLITALGLLALRLAEGRRAGRGPRVGRRLAVGRRRALVALASALLVVGYVFLAFGLPAQIFLLNYFPPPVRLPIFLAVLVAMLPFFLADEALTRGPWAPRGGYAITKLLFLGSLALAIALNPRELFFLVLIAPLLLAYFCVYGLFSTLCYRRTGAYAVGALANSAIFAWIVAAVFPLVG